MSWLGQSPFSPSTEPARVNPPDPAGENADFKRHLKNWAGSNGAGSNGPSPGPARYLSSTCSVSCSMRRSS
ncbi:unnamed protein product [Linum trigynum]|uniref:Uncharacterized protein n=1 Tax=Linum trigynum TaxID=586398 RepID=A0AAV2EG41_9ROSI